MSGLSNDMFVFFGAIVSVGELAAATARFATTEGVYGLVYGAGLEYRRVGNSKTSRECVVGVELHHESSFTAFKVVHDVNDVPSLATRAGAPLLTKLETITENEVRRKLQSIGILKKPEYFVLQSYNLKGSD